MIRAGAPGITGRRFVPVIFLYQGFDRPGFKQLYPSLPTKGEAWASARKLCETTKNAVAFIVDCEVVA